MRPQPSRRGPQRRRSGSPICRLTHQTRTDPLLRKIGWFAALGFFSNGMWEILYPTRQYVLAQLVFFGILASAGAAYFTSRRSIRVDVTRDKGVERWLIAPAFGLFFGWVTAAILVGIVSTLVAVGVFAGGTGEALVGALLLILGGLAASAVLLVSRGGPLQGTVTYGLAVLWALVGVIVNQYQSSLVTTTSAAISALLVAGVLLTAVFRARSQRSGGREVGKATRSQVS